MKNIISVLVVICLIGGLTMCNNPNNDDGDDIIIDDGKVIAEEFRGTYSTGGNTGYVFTSNELIKYDGFQSVNKIEKYRCKSWTVDNELWVHGIPYNITYYGLNILGEYNIGRFENNSFRLYFEEFDDMIFPKK